MAITTMDQLIAGFTAPVSFHKVCPANEEAGIAMSLNYCPGTPGVSPTPTGGINGTNLTSFSGQLPFTNPASGLSSYLGRLAVTASSPGVLILYDRVWHNSGLSPTDLSKQNLTTPTFPRDDYGGGTIGTPTLGTGIWMGLEISTATTNAQVDGAFGQIGATGVGSAVRVLDLPYYPAAMLAGTFLVAEAQNNRSDYGVRTSEVFSVFSSLGGGAAIHLVAYRILGVVPVTVPDVEHELTIVSGAGFRRLWDNTVPCMLWIPSGTGPTTISGQMIVAQG